MIFFFRYYFIHLLGTFDVCCDVGNNFCSILFFPIEAFVQPVYLLLLFINMNLIEQHTIY